MSSVPLYNSIYVVKIFLSFSKKTFSVGILTFSSECCCWMCFLSPLYHTYETEHSFFGHLNGFSPVWVMLCFRSDSLVKNERSHLSHWKNKKKSDYFWNILFDLPALTLLVFCFSWMFRMCLTTLLAVRNFIGQNWHVYGWTPLWVRSWIRRFAFVFVLNSQLEHWKSFASVWTTRWLLAALVVLNAFPQIWNFNWIQQNSFTIERKLVFNNK